MSSKKFALKNDPPNFDISISFCGTRWLKIILTKKYLVLHLRRCNIDTVRLSTSSLPNLTELNLQGNRISILIDSALNLSNLQHLSLENNRILVLNRHAFRGLRKLEYVNLSGNRLFWISPDGNSNLNCKPAYPKLSLVMLEYWKKS